LYAIKPWIWPATRIVHSKDAEISSITCEQNTKESDGKKLAKTKSSHPIDQQIVAPNHQDEAFTCPQHRDPEDKFIGGFPRPPLYSTALHSIFGTRHTAIERPSLGEMDIR
jgi:hypothetical protein